MSISVIIPAYKAVQTIERALASVAGQSLKPDEVIVVDDGSEDGTFEVAEAFRSQMNGINYIVVQQDNLGAGAARNRAIAESTGEWLAFLDSDDEWLPEKLAISMRAIEDNGLTLFAHNYLAINGTQKTLLDCAERFNAVADPYVGLYRKGFLATSTVVVRRNSLIEAGNFDEALATAQDFDLWLKILKKKGSIFSIHPNVLMYYHVTPGSITSHTARRLECTLHIAQHHAPSLVDHWYRIIALHYEAVSASHRQGRPAAVFRYLAALPIQLLRASHFHIVSKILRSEH